LRELLNVSNDYEVLFLQGGGWAENAIVPLNLLEEGGTADYVVSGQWSAKSAQEAARYGKINIACNAYAMAGSDKNTGESTSDNARVTNVPDASVWQRTPGARYLHLCTNETIDGVEFQAAPDVTDTPLVADMSSHILSRVIDVNKFGVIYGGAQKNIGPAGLTIVIVRKDLLGRAQSVTPSVFNWQVQAGADSMFNTPPTYSIYIAGLVFKWLKAQGGVAAIEAKNIAKAKLLYDTIDASALYENKVQPSYRSRMNVPFFLKDESLNAAFLKGAQARGMVQLKGHRAVGGMRASIYNAMPIEGVLALVNYMREFERNPAHG
jgi:phosphoserine aminotransferase